MSVLVTLKRLEAATKCPTNEAVKAAKKFEADPEATPRVLAAFLMGLEGRWKDSWSDGYLVANAVFEVMWHKRDESNRLETLLYMLDAFLCDEVIRMNFHEMQLDDTYFAVIMSELSAQERVQMALYVLDVGVGRLAEGKIYVDGIKHAAGLYAMTAEEFLFGGHSRLDLDELRLNGDQRGGYKILKFAYDRFMSEAGEFTLEDLVGATKHLFGIEVPDSHSKIGSVSAAV